MTRFTRKKVKLKALPLNQRLFAIESIKLKIPNDTNNDNVIQVKI
jgi:hypothetical protein